MNYVKNPDSSPTPSYSKDTFFNSKSRNKPGLGRLCDLLVSTQWFGGHDPPRDLFFGAQMVQIWITLDIIFVLKCDI